MKRFLFELFAAFICLAVNAQADMGKLGMISLNPYIPAEENLSEQATIALRNKLQQIATVGGMTGEGFDNRFIITAHLQVLEKSETMTTPNKTAVKLCATIYIGDGIDGTLYSSYSKEVKGIGESESHAYMSAIRKLPVRDPNLQQAVEQGKQRIIQYYEQIAPNIISTAKSAAAGGNYDEAISMLFSIPMANVNFSTAQSLIAEYAATALDKTNQLVLNNARAAWSTSADEAGAAKAAEILKELNNPSPQILAQAKALSNEMAQRMKAVSDREWQLVVQQEQNSHKQEMARINSERQQNVAAINAAASVARAYYNSKPRVVYHVRSWWW